MTDRSDRPGGPEGGPCLTRRELALRWRVSVRTLERWRVAGTGPAWMTLNGSVRYRAEDVLAFERARLRQPKP